MNKQFAMVLGAVVLITAGIVGFVLWDEAKTSKRLSAEAAPVGLTALAESWDDGDDRQDGHTVTFAYVDADAEVHTRTLKRITWFDEAKSYKVCYDPANPRNARLYEASHVCGS